MSRLPGDSRLGLLPKVIRLRAIAPWPPLVRMVVFLAGVVVLWLPVALPFYWLSAQGALPGGDLIPTALLYCFFLGLLPRWERQVHRLTKPWQAIGLSGGQLVPLCQGLGVGLASIAVLLVIQLTLGWAEILPAERNWAALFLAGGLTAMAVGWAEELLFRGWLLHELAQGGSKAGALIGTSVIFALAHFIKPVEVILDTWPQFLGLLLLGLSLGWARRIPTLHQGRVLKPSLGLPVGLHGGLVWGYYFLSVGDLSQPTGVVPAWVTGIDGNPLAGMVGIGLLSGLAVWGYRLSHRRGSAV